MRKTFLRLLLSALALGLLAGLFWGGVAVAGTWSVRGENHDLVRHVGLIGVVTTLLATGLALIHGAILGAVSEAGLLPRRLAIHGTVYLALAIGWSAFSIHEVKRHDPPFLLSRGDYAGFARVVSSKKDEAWAAALLAADPKAMRLCAEQGVTWQTLAKVGTIPWSREPWTPAPDLVVKHEYWRTGTPEQQARVAACLKILQELGADLASPCLDAGFTTPREYANQKNLPALGRALTELGVE